MTDLAKQKQKIDPYLVLCCLVALLTGLLSFAYFIYTGHGAFTLIDDFNAQMIAFAASIQTVLKEQTPGQWCWNLDIGSSLITGFGYYELGSVFYWISYIFPKTWFPYLVGWLYVLKYVVAAAAAYLYLKLFVSNKTLAVAGSIIYAFSGFQATNLEFYIFHDMVAFFPLLLLGLEYMLREDMRGGGYIRVCGLFELHNQLLLLCSGTYISCNILSYKILETAIKSFLQRYFALCALRRAWRWHGCGIVPAQYNLCFGQYPQQQKILPFVAAV